MIELQNINENIILIGMPGAGKSTIGVILAKTLGLSFIDTDLIIQDREKRLLQSIINQEGMSTFLDIERDSVLMVEGSNMVIATGGSVVYRPQAMKHLRSLGTILYLDIRYEEIYRRVKNITTRGIALEVGYTLEDVYKERSKLYEQYKDIKIDCNKKTVEEIIEEIINKLMKKKLKN